MNFLQENALMLARMVTEEQKRGILIKVNAITGENTVTNNSA
jgi:hypothetical protein